jgi:dTDP-glucose pyrophosphorylase/CBS domain-containing protein
MIDSKYIIHQEETLLEALNRIAILKYEPLVLLVIDDDSRMVGTLTDGDSRRALISGHTLENKVKDVMHRSFRYLQKGVNDDVENLRKQKELNMKLVPVLDSENHIIEILDLVHYITRLPIDAVLMAGGKGERLRPLTETTPKPLLKVGNKCIIDHNVDRLITYGVKYISVTVNYLKEQIEEHFKEPRGSINIQTIREPQFLGTIGSIKFVPEYHNDVILVMNSDLFTNIDYEDFYFHFMHHNADMSVAAVPYNVSIPYGILELEGRNIKGLLEKPRYVYYVNAGIYLIRRSLLSEIPEGEFFNATDLIEKLIAQGRTVVRYPLNGTWVDIGNPQEYQKAQDLVKHLR